MPPQDLSADDIAVIVRLLRDTNATDPFPLSPRIRPLKAVIAKLHPSVAPVARAADPTFHKLPC
jgi:hypothetical protein